MAVTTALAILALASAPALADQVQNHEWWLKSLHVTRAWEFSQGHGAVVALLDSGVDPAQPDLMRSVISGPDYTNSGRVPGGPFWGIHGTEMASLIAGHGHGQGNADGIVGIAPRARVLSVRVTLDHGDPLLADPGIAGGLPHAIARGIRYAVRHGADVIDLPLDPVLTPGAPGAGGSGEEQSAVRFALAHHVVLVAPAGDDGATLNTVNYPASYHGVISVGAFDHTLTRAPFSSGQPYVKLTAAGAGMVAATPGGKYAQVNSTSAASALVSGIVALIRAQFPKLSVAQVTRALIEGVGFRHQGGPTAGSGYGTADAAKALAAASKIYESLPSKPAGGGQRSTAPSPPQEPRVKPQPNDHLGRTLVIDAAIAAGVFVCLLGLILAAGAVRRRRARAARLAKVRASTAPPGAAKARKQPARAGRATGPALVPAGSLAAGPATAGPAAAGAAAAASPPVSEDPSGRRSAGATASRSHSQPPDEITLAPISPPPTGSPAAAVFGLPSAAGAKPAARAPGDTEGAFPTSAFGPSPGSARDTRTTGPAGGTHRGGTVRSSTVSGRPPWDPAPQPDSELPWTQPPPPGPVIPEAGTPPPATPESAIPALSTLNLGTPAAGTPGAGPGDSPMPPPPAGGPAMPALHLSADADTGSWEAVAQDAWPGGPGAAVQHPPAEPATGPDAIPSPRGAQNGAPRESFTPRPGGQASTPWAEPAQPATGSFAGGAPPRQAGDRPPPDAARPTSGRPPWELETTEPGEERPAAMPPPATPPAAMPPPATMPPPAQERAGTGSGPQPKEPAPASSQSQPRASGSGSANPLPRRVVRHRQDVRPGAGRRPLAGHGQFVPSSPPSDLFAPSSPSGDLFGAGGPPSDPPSLFPPVPPEQTSGPFSLLHAGESTETFAALPAEEPGDPLQPGEPEAENEQTETFPAIGPDEPGGR